MIDSPIEKSLHEGTVATIEIPKGPSGNYVIHFSRILDLPTYPPI